MPRRSPRSRMDAAVDGGERARDHGDAPVEPQHGLREQPEAPVHRGAQAPLAGGHGCLELGLRGGVDDLGVELVEQLVRRQHPQRRRGELDRQRDAVEAAADRADEREVGRCRLEVRPGGERPLEEQLGGRVVADGVGIQLALGGDGQRLDPQDMLARHPEGEPARHHDPEARCPGLEIGERRRGGPDVLGGVEDEQRGRPAQLVGERLVERLVERAAGLVGDADRAGDRRQHERRVAHPVERHEGDPALPAPEVLGGELRGEAALPHPADARQRDERRAGIQGEAAQLGEVGVAPDERGRRALGRGRWPARAHVGGGIVGTSRGVVDGGGEVGGGRVSRRVRQGPEHTPGTGTAGCA